MFAPEPLVATAHRGAAGGARRADAARRHVPRCGSRPTTCWCWPTWRRRWRTRTPSSCPMPAGRAPGSMPPTAAALLARHADWPPPAEGLAQGAAAGRAGEGARGRRRGTLLRGAAAVSAAELAERLGERVRRDAASRCCGSPRRAASYDVVIVGGGGHGLATAYYLATRHGITNVAVLERSYIGAGNSGRNTTVIRANYGIPEAVAFYQRSLELYEGLEAELDRAVMHSHEGPPVAGALRGDAAHREGARGAEHRLRRARPSSSSRTRSRACARSSTSTGGGKFPVLGASYHPRGATARHDRVVWGYAEGAMPRGVHVHQGVGGDRPGARRRPRHRRRDERRADRRGRRAGRRRRPRHDAGDDGRRAPADPHPPAAGGGHEPLPADARADRDLVRPARVRLADAARRVAVRRRDRPAGELLVPLRASTSCRTARCARSRCCRSCAGCACCGSGSASAT